MEEKKTKKSLGDVHKEHREAQWSSYWTPQNWRAWGSWFSWGSPIGLTLGYAIVMLSTGAFIWLLSVSK